MNKKDSCFFIKNFGLSISEKNCHLKLDTIHTHSRNPFSTF